MISMTRGGGGWKNQDRKPCNCPDLVLLSWKLPGSSEGSNKDFPPLLFLIFHQGRSGTEFRRVCRSKLSADEKDGEEKRRNSVFDFDNFAITRRIWHWRKDGGANKTLTKGGFKMQPKAVEIRSSKYSWKIQPWKIYLPWNFFAKSAKLEGKIEERN